MIPSRETRKNWRIAAENTCMVSAVGEYTPKEFIVLLDAVDSLQDGLETAIRWLRRLEKEYPGCLNDDAISKHLESKLQEATPHS